MNEKIDPDDKKLHPLQALGFTGSREWVVPLKIKGTFTTLHKWSSAALVAFLVIVPWLRWGGHPLILADVPGRRLIVFGSMFNASEGVLIMLGALTAAFGLFFFTTLFGRLWCGYACPQSVFLINVVHPIEEFFEGTRSQRLRRFKEGWTADNTWRRLGKWGAYLAVAAFISMSFMGFFVPTGELWTGQAGWSAYGVVGFFTFLWFWDFAWYREQVCNYICPYARFQGALTDDQSLVISYDEPRGEPRGKAAKARGGCIDCNKCVVVCPQGIDIRDGYQLECIACGRCIDACESVMSRLGHETLVRYSTFTEDEGGTHRWIRPRTIAYTVLLSVLVGAIGYVVTTREEVDVVVDRAPGSLFVEDADGYVRNTFLVHVFDRDLDPGTRTYALAVDGLPEGVQVRSRPIQVETGERASTSLVVRVPRDLADRTMPFDVILRGADVAVEWPTTFKGPGAVAPAVE